MFLPNGEIVESPFVREMSMYTVLESFLKSFNEYEVSSKWVGYLKLYNKEQLEHFQAYADRCRKYESLLDSNLVSALVSEAMFQGGIDKIKFENPQADFTLDRGITLTDLTHVQCIKKNLKNLLNNAGTRSLVYYVRCFDAKTIHLVQDNISSYDGFTDKQNMKLKAVFNHVLLHLNENIDKSRTRKSNNK